MLGKMVIHSVNASFLPPCGLWLSLYIVYRRWYNSKRCENEQRMNYDLFFFFFSSCQPRNQECLHSDFYLCACEGLLSNVHCWIPIDGFRFRVFKLMSTTYHGARRTPVLFPLSPSTRMDGTGDGSLSYFMQIKTYCRVSSP